MIKGFDYLQAGAGLNKGQAPHSLNPGEFQQLENFYPFSGRLRRRGGVRRITSNGAWDSGSTLITGIFPYKKADGTWVLLVASGTKFGKLDGNSIVDLTEGTGVSTPATTNRPWTMFQYLNHTYALRAGHNQMLRLTDDSYLQAGISAPATAMTISEGAAGNLSSADYITVVTFGNQATGMESNPSPASNTLSLAASKKIDYASIPVSANPFVDMRRIYRTLPDQVGEYFLVTQINDNSTTTYTGDNVGVADLGVAVSNSNGTPPSGLEVGTIWNERLFASDGTKLYPSEYLLPEMFSGNFISVYPDDGHVIRGLLAFGDRLLVGKTNKMYYLVGTDASDFALHTLSDAHGLLSAHSFKSAENLAFWFGTGNRVYRTDGTSVVDISTPRVQPFLDDIPEGFEDYIVAQVYPERNWYMLSIPQSDYGAAGGDPPPEFNSNYHHRVLVYNYKDGTWTVFKHYQNAPEVFGDFYDTNYEHEIYASFYDGHLYKYEDTTYGLDAPGLTSAPGPHTISATLRTRKDDFGFPGYRKFFTEVWVLMPNVNTGTMQVEVFRDDQTTAVIDRTASLNFPNAGYKAWGVNNFRKPGSTLDMRLTYAGQTAVDIDALHFEVGLLPRKPMRVR